MKTFDWTTLQTLLAKREADGVLTIAIGGHAQTYLETRPERTVCCRVSDAALRLATASWESFIEKQSVRALRGASNLGTTTLVLELTEGTVVTLSYPARAGEALLLSPAAGTRLRRR